VVRVTAYGELEGNEGSVHSDRCDPSRTGLPLQDVKLDFKCRGSVLTGFVWFRKGTADYTR
jgi:hypothetical protein